MLQQKPNVCHMINRSPLGADQRRRLWAVKKNGGIMHSFGGNKENSFMQMERSMMASSSSPGSSLVPEDADMITKIKAAWRIFFPEKKSLSPKEEGKKRLRMILVADRCGMSSDSLVGMKESIVRAMSDFVEVEAEEAVETNMSMDPEVGTIYSVAVPIRRVKPVFRPVGGQMSESSSTSLPGEWNPFDPDSDPSDQFPYGT
eukprot:jgi/Picsp_1/4809/NSC_02177-R1_protein